MNLGFSLGLCCGDKEVSEMLATGGTLELGRADVLVLVFCSYESKVEFTYIFMLRNAPRSQVRKVRLGRTVELIKLRGVNVSRKVAI